MLENIYVMEYLMKAHEMQVQQRSNSAWILALCN